MARRIPTPFPGRITKERRQEMLREARAHKQAGFPGAWDWAIEQLSRDI